VSLSETFIVSLVLSIAVFMPQWRYGFNWADEGWLWYVSQRVAAGDLPLRDIFSYDPGRYIWSAAWFALLGSDGLLEQRIANAAFGVIGLVCAYGCLVSAGIPRLWRILTAILIALALGFPRHKTYEQALSLVAVAATMFVLIRPASAVRWITLGLASGLAAFIGRNSGLFFLITGLFVLLWEGKDSLRSTSIRRTAAYGLGVIVGYMPMLWLITADLKFRDAFIESIRFTKT
jgi:hypothetical protein